MADSPVKTSALLASEPAWTDGSPDSGSSTPASFARYDPASSSWRTSQVSLFGGLTAFSARLPNSGTMRSGRLYPLPKWEPRTFVADSSSSVGYPTPVSADAKGAMSHGGRGNPSLTAVIRYPTPSATPYGSNQAGSVAHPRPGEKVRLSLDSMARRNMWPTPTTQDGENNGAPSQHERNSLPLNAQAGGALNPEWVELLMGFCPGHTEARTPSDGSEE